MPEPTSPLIVRRYSGIAIALHWLVAIGILVNIALPWIWPHLADESVRSAIDTHKSIGITILGLAILRLLWRLGHTPPPMPQGYRPWEAHLAHGVHWALYALLFAMPLTGWIMDSAYKDAAAHPMFWFGLFEWPRIGPVLHMATVPKATIHDGFGAAHVWFSYLLYGLFALHVLGALKHQLQGEKELQRMLP